MNIHRTAALACLAALAAGPALAGDTGAYAGAAIGFNRGGSSSDFRDALSQGYGSHRLSEDRTDLGGRVFVGYRPHRNFAVEGGWSHFGTAGANAATTLPLGTVAAERETAAWFIDAVGIAPVSERLDLTARLGVAFWRVETSTTTRLQVSQVAATGDRAQSGSAPRLGVGLQYRVSDRASLGLDLETFRAGKSGGVGRATVTTVVAGVKFAF